MNAKRNRLTSVEKWRKLDYDAVDKANRGILNPNPCQPSLSSLCNENARVYPYPMPYYTSNCLSWRVGVEANNVRCFHTVPRQCVTYIENYMLGGQYNSDIGAVIEQIFTYLDETVPSDDGKDAWIFGVDDTCLSNFMSYERKHFGGEPYDPMSFKNWAERGMCPAIPAVLGLYRRLLQSGYKVFLITGRDEV